MMRALVPLFVLILLLFAIVYKIYSSFFTRKHSCILKEVLETLPNRWRSYWDISRVFYALLFLSFLVAGLVLCIAYGAEPAAEPPILPQDLEPFSDFKFIHGEELELFYDRAICKNGNWVKEPRIIITRKLADEQSVRCDIWVKMECPSFLYQLL